MSKYIFLWIGILWFGTISVVGAEVIRVSATQGDATPRIQAAIEKARQYRGKPVVIRLEQGNYHLFRTSCSKQVCIFRIRLRKRRILIRRNTSAWGSEISRSKDGVTW
ncbi:MAG: hypothetical protein ACLU30_16120 [Odoribacter splanchnicus]